MYFLIKYNELLEKYNEVWENVKNSIKKELDSEPVYNEKYLKAKFPLEKKILMEKILMKKILMKKIKYRT